MKLTPAQIKALQAVAKGEVELYSPHDMRKPIKIWGAHTGVITRLADASLIKPVPTDSFTTKVFILTEAGKKHWRLKMTEIKTDKDQKPKRILQIGGLYEHFKGGIYQVFDEAKHSETGETLVIYTSQKDGHICARPKDMFLSEVDRNKYPDATQKYRFEYIENQGITVAALNQIEALADKATPGDWFSTCDSLSNLVVNSVINDRIEVKICSFEKADIRDREANADYISRLNPAKIKMLVSTIRDQEKQLKEYFFRVRDYGHATDLLVCFLFELCEGIQPGYSDSHNELEARNFLREQIKRLREENGRLKVEAHDLDSSGGEMAKDIAKLEKMVAWLAKQAQLLCSTGNCNLCRASCPDGDGENAWIEAASKSTENQCKSN